MVTSCTLSLVEVILLIARELFDVGNSSVLRDNTTTQLQTQNMDAYKPLNGALGVPFLAPSILLLGVTMYS